ncbi:hypothetical protein SNEBB_006727 [Seison nebaliae]|nr:hypothetical protein SNEBB_006727 [Seison nebaliae]
MKLYHLTLQNATTITQSVHGSFTGISRQQEIVLARGRFIELIKYDTENNKLVTIHNVDTFSVIRSLATFRLTGSNKDYLVVGSDSGRVSILEFSIEKNIWDIRQMETFGKSGVRRAIPGQYLAVDPKGRAIMVGSIEKQKFVYIMNRDNEANLTISSPLEAHKSNTIIFHMIGVDVGYENPIFACLELNYEESDMTSISNEEDRKKIEENLLSGEGQMGHLDYSEKQLNEVKQQLTFYELDLGLNHVVRKYSEPLDEPANYLISVPGGDTGPSGLIICSENYITYKNFGDQPDIKMQIPHRRNSIDDHNRKIIITTSAMHKIRLFFFFFLQTDQGDLFKVTLTTKDDLSVSEMVIKYFDTIPVATSLNILRSGLLFCAAEFGNHHLYRITSLGDHEDEIQFSSLNSDNEQMDYFQPRSLRNMNLIDELTSFSPIIQMYGADLAHEDHLQLYMLCGRSAKSTLRILRHGLEISELAVSELPYKPTAVWTLKKKNEEKYDSSIIISFDNATLVLSIGETVEEIVDSGFIGTTSTINCYQMADDALVQVYPKGIRHIRSDERVNEWTPGRRTITHCAINERQIVIALSGGELIYFEMDIQGQLKEYNEQYIVSSDVTCMSLPKIEQGERQARWLAIGLSDHAIKIISLDVDDCLQPLATQSVDGIPESIVFIRTHSTQFNHNLTTTSSSTMLGSSILYLCIGLNNGLLIRTAVDDLSGALINSRTRYLGNRPLKLIRTSINNCDALLALSSRSWLGYMSHDHFEITPLSYNDLLEYGAGFSSQQCADGLVAISGATLRILGLEKLNVKFHETQMKLNHTPRRFIVNPANRHAYIIERDYLALTISGKKERKEQLGKELEEAAKQNKEMFLKENTTNGTEDELSEEKLSELKQQQQFVESTAEALIDKSNKFSEDVFGAPKSSKGSWASLIRLINCNVSTPNVPSTQELIEVEPNEATHSICLVDFQPNQRYLLVGVSKDYVLNPKENKGGYIYTFRISSSSDQSKSQMLDFVHKTPIEDVPGAICAFQGKVLISVGKNLRLYDLGRRRLLKKCENKLLPHQIVDIQAIGNRVFVGDIRESVHLLLYKDNHFLNLADDTLPRYITAMCILDYNTVAVADKFGTFAVLRLEGVDTVDDWLKPHVTNSGDDHDDLDERVGLDPSGTKGLWDRGLLNGANNKLYTLCQFRLAETVTSLQRVSLVPGNNEVLLYGTISGSIGVFIPFKCKPDYAFFQHLEMHMRQEYRFLTGRDHLTHRSAFLPIRNCIDGDLCEKYNTLDLLRKKNVADDLDRTTNEMSKKLEDIRVTNAF